LWVRRGHTGRDGRQVWRLRDGGVPRVETRIGTSHHADLAVAAWEIRRPLHGIVAVRLLHGVHVEHAAGAPAAAHVLLHVDVAARGPELPRHRVCPQVRRALHDDAEGSVADGARDVVHEHCAVAGFHGHSGIDRDFEGGLGYRPSPQCVRWFPHRRSGASGQPHAIDWFAGLEDLARDGVAAHGAADRAVAAE
jgi:hypothetical protein